MDDLTSGFNIGTNYSLAPEFNEMTGFTEDEVRDMLGYYSSVLPFNHSVDELIKVMKPWYDNYCFAEEEYGKTTMYNSVMVLNFLDKYIRNNYDIPKNMVESNVRIDYDKVRMLIRHDKEFAHDASIIQQLVTQGFVTGKLVENFPAERINDPDNFLSLLFYFGMVTIDGTYDGSTKFIIPNEVVRDQMYTYLLDTYKENDLTYDSYNKGKLEAQLAYHGNYKAYFEFIADSLKRYSSQRDKQKGEAFVHGFTLAMTSQNQFYRPISELDNDGGYADIFLSNDPDNFLSLLFYFGMVTIDGTYDGSTKFIIPNEVVRDQMYTYLLDTYKENDLTYDSYNKGKLEAQLAYHGNYKAYFEFIADSLKRYSSQRDKQKGEAFVHGFTLAMTSQNQFYRPISELDNDGGYADIFLSPLCDIYKDMVDSYIIELKYCKTNKIGRASCRERV